MYHPILYHLSDTGSFFTISTATSAACSTVLSALRPAVVALIASAGLSILLLGLFMSDLSGITLANFRPIETCLFIGGLFLLRKYRVNAIAIIFGTGVVGTLAYSLLGMVA